MKSNEAELSLRERVNAGLARNWKTALIVLGLAAIVMIGILVFGAVQKNRSVDSAVLSEDIQDSYIDWIQQAPDERSDEEIEGLIEKALDEYPRMFAAQRAYFTRGLMALEKEEWDRAVEAFTTLADKWDKSYLTPVSLFNAGSAYEEAGDIEAAKTVWNRVVDEYSEVAPDAAEAMFNLARVTEQTGSAEEAITLYKNLGSRFPDSRWTDLGKSRILVLESRSQG